jgi:hypothetical protein
MSKKCQVRITVELDAGDSKEVASFMGPVLAEILSCTRRIGTSEALHSGPFETNVGPDRLKLENIDFNVRSATLMSDSARIEYAMTAILEPSESLQKDGEDSWQLFLPD